MAKQTTLAEWARQNGIDPSNARHRALDGKLKTAVKVGGTWLINDDEPLIDNRVRTGKFIGKKKIKKKTLPKK